MFTFINWSYLAEFKVLGKVPSDIEELNRLHISGTREADSFL